jgi:cytochrome c oxidase accessory protein FixG
MEMLFRKIEYWIEGDDKAQRRLNESPWTNEKILKKGSKHTLFIFLAFAISNTFLMYIIGKEEWIQIVLGNPAEHIIGLAAMLIFTAVFYFVFARFREMVCMVVCPYGRLQGVLLDNNSILVQYDHVRGEPRGKAVKTESKGDCIDCHWCVRVCPTGIDIRNGSNQLECIGCTSCIDACDAVMEKIDKPKGLIRYDSLNGVNSGTQLKFTLRIGAYVSALALIVGILAFMLVTRRNWESTLLRTPGMTFQVDEKLHTVSNIYNLAIINKSMEDQSFRVHVDKPLELIWIGNGIGQIEKGKQVKTEFFIKTKIGSWKQGEKILIHIQNNQGQEETLKTSFIQPDE